MESHYRFLMLGIPWTHSMSSRDINAATRLAEASWRRNKYKYKDRSTICSYSFGNKIQMAPQKSVLVRSTSHDLHGTFLHFISQ